MCVPIVYGPLVNFLAVPSDGDKEVEEQEKEYANICVCVCVCCSQCLT